MMAQNDPQWPTFGDQDSSQNPQDPVPEGLSEAQLAALDMILGGASDSAVARELKVGRRTVYRWRVEHALFSQELARRRRLLWERGVDRFRDLTGLALDRLEAQIRDPYAPISMQAARAVVALAQLGKAAGAADVPQRKSALYCSGEPTETDQKPRRCEEREEEREERANE
jgi:hypothetical protein